MVLYTFCPECGRVVDEFETQCGWCNSEDSEVDNIEDLNKKRIGNIHISRDDLKEILIKSYEMGHNGYLCLKEENSEKIIEDYIFNKKYNLFNYNEDRQKKFNF
jgi:hypothetical protein